MGKEELGEVIVEGVYNKNFQCFFKGNCIIKNLKPLFEIFDGKNIRLKIEVIKTTTK